MGGLDGTDLFTILPKNIVQPLIASLWDLYIIKLAMQLDLHKYVNMIVTIPSLIIAVRKLHLFRRNQLSHENVQ